MKTDDKLDPIEPCERFLGVGSIILLLLVVVWLALNFLPFFLPKDHWYVKDYENYKRQINPPENYMQISGSVKRTTDENEANRYIANGWKILKVETTSNAWNGNNTYYILQKL
jgi:hypothetical protein